MAAITKNRQSKETIIKMAKAAFPDKDVLHIKELTEGMCNVTYCITFQDGSESILKISAKDQSGNISNEIGLMRAEVEAMRLVAKHHTCKVADVGYYDCSRTICDGDYFFMEKLPGVNYSFVKDGMPKEKSRQIDEEIGRIQRELTHIQNHEFGFLGDEKRYPSLFEFVKVMLTNLLADAKSQNIDIALDEDTYLRRLDADRDVFSAVQSASLVHWDMWEGNVFVEQDHVSGIIDWERALWGEHNQNYLLSGYTKEDIRFLREQFVKNLKIHLLGTLIGLLVLISVFSNDEISMVRLFLGAFVFFINLYSALLQRYNLIRIDRILAGRMKRAEKRQRVQG